MLTEQQKWRAQVFRNTIVHITDVLEEDFAKALPLLTSEAKHSGVTAVLKMQEARDALHEFIDTLDEERTAVETNALVTSSKKFEEELK